MIPNQNCSPGNFDVLLVLAPTRAWSTGHSMHAFNGMPKAPSPLLTALRAGSPSRNAQATHNHCQNSHLVAFFFFPNHSSLLFSEDVFVYIFKYSRRGERERENKVFNLLTPSSNSNNGWDSVRPKPGAQDLLCISPNWVQRANPLDHLSLPSQEH